MLYNIIKTVRAGQAVTDELDNAPALEKISNKRGMGEKYHSWLERRPVQLTLLATIAILIGGIIQIVPTIMVKSNIPTIEAVKPYTALELEGRDLYIREGCVSCHSQMIRPFRSEVERYGPFYKGGEFVYDHPFLWGSKRTGPDLLRIGGKYSDSWHLNHLYDPQSTSPGSIMPAYSWLYRNALNTRETLEKMRVMTALGVPYSEEEIENALKDMATQADGIVDRLMEDPQFAQAYQMELNSQGNSEDFIPLSEREIIALIAYLQRLGTDATQNQ